MPVDVSDGLTNAFTPQIIANPVGDFVSVWEQKVAGLNTILSSKSLDGGLTWQAIPSVVSGPNSRRVQIAVDSAGLFVTVWQNDTTIGISSHDPEVTQEIYLL